MSRRLQVPADQRGFTLIELLVAMVIFSIVSITFYSVLFNARDTADQTRAITQVSAEARKGFNRLLRDTREASVITDVTANGYTILNNFDGDSNIGEADPADASGSYERLIILFTPAGNGQGTITVTNGLTAPEPLIDHVDCIRQPDDSCYPVFAFSGNELSFDTNGDGISSGAEIDAATTVGNGNGVLDGSELDFVDTVRFGMRIEIDGRPQNFYGESQMRNQR